MARIDPASLDQLLHPTIDPHARRDIIGSGLPASPGAATGEIVFSSDEAVQASRKAARSFSFASRRVLKTFTACMLLKAY